MKVCSYLPFGGLLLVSLLMTSPTMAEDDSYDTEAKEIGYFLGVSVGQQMGSQGFQVADIDMDTLAKGIADGISGEEPNMSNEQLKAVQGKVEALLRKRQESKVVRNKEKGMAWLAENAKKEGVKKLEGGVQYKVLQEGDGASPSESDTVRVHYTGKLISGKVFDSSVARGEPAEFRVGQVIKGWQMALQEMKVGSKWMLYIPPDLAYGERGSPGAIGPNEVLVFEVELLDIP